MQSCTSASSGTNKRTALLKRVLAGDLSGRGCLFLDRDGVINERCEGGYITAWENFNFRPHAIAALCVASTHMPLIVVSNQRCVGRGVASADQVRSLMDRMCEELHSHGVKIAAWYACPHDIADDCDCRKPRPGMLLQAASDLNVSVASSFMIGDSTSDVMAGEAAGCRRSILCDPLEPQALVGAIDMIKEAVVHGQ